MILIPTYYMYYDLFFTYLTPVMTELHAAGHGMNLRNT